MLDYTHDSYFATNATAQAALQAAADHVSAAINYAGTALIDSHDVVTGMSEGSTAAYDFEFEYQNPSNGAIQTLASIGDLSGGGLGVGEIRVFVGVRMLSGTTLGEGGPGVTAAMLSGSNIGSGFPAAVANANSAASLAYGRGDGGVIGSLNGTLGGEVVMVEIGPTIGNMWFDSDTNNDGMTDFDSWHFDHTTPVEAGKNDLYSVAVHEIVHAIGFGISETWNTLASGNDWTGANVIALQGTGQDVISGGHIAPDTMSTSIVDGSAQEAALDPTLTTGTRKHLTALDLAFLKDIGFSNVTAVPEPSSAFVGVFFAVAAARKRSRRER